MATIHPSSFPEEPLKSAVIRARAIYANAGIPLSSDTIFTSQAFEQALKAIEKKLAQIKCRIVPSSFYPDEHVQAMPISLMSCWDSCVMRLKEHGARGVMTRLPLFWQTESLLHDACRQAGAFIYPNDIANMPIGALALAIGEIDTIVTTAKDAGAFSRYLSENGFPINKLWIIIYEPEECADELPLVLAEESVPVAREVHLFPGVPFLWQCATLSKEKSFSFHVAENFIIEKESEGLIITDTQEDSPLPLFRYVCPVPIFFEKTCPCGSQIFTLKR